MRSTYSLQWVPHSNNNNNTNSMVFIACGINHNTAPIDLREKLTPTSTIGHDLILNNLLALPEINEAALLHTCNRTEIYCDTTEPNIIAPWLANSHGLESDALKPHFYLHQGPQGIKHTLRVASGLDSMILGEPQILGQMKEAYQKACHLGSVKTTLRPVFEYVFSATKRVRTLSRIGSNPISVAYAAVQLVGQLFTDLSALKIFLIGSGETSSLVAKHLRQQGATQFLVASRTIEHAQQLATEFYGQPVGISDIPHTLPQADVVISATACPLPFITKGMVEQALKVRDHAPMFFLDLAVPRDIEPNIAELDQVHLYNIDDLKVITDHGLKERRNKAVQAEQLIDIELDNFIRWHRSLQAKDVICNYRDTMHQLAQLEVHRAINKLTSGKDQQQVLQELSERLVNKLAHNPTEGLRKIAWDGREDLLTLIKYLFTTTTEHQTSYEEIS